LRLATTQIQSRSHAIAIVSGIFITVTYHAAAAICLLHTSHACAARDRETTNGTLSLCEPNACGGFLGECFACRKQILTV